MVARILIVNEYKVDLSTVLVDLQELHNVVLFSKSLEDSLRIVGTQSISIVFMVLPSVKTKLFSDFFSVMRQLCGIIPIIGIFDGDTKILPQYADFGLDDCISTDIDKATLARKINVLIRISNLFDDSLLNNIYFSEKRSQKIVTIFHNNIDFLQNIISSHRTSITQVKSWPIIDDMSDADIFLINISHNQAYECCANLRLRRINKYKPIILTYTDNNLQKVQQVLEMDIGYTDIINIETKEAAFIAYKLKSMMRYKRMYESFSDKLKKSIFLSAIDATTGVYNRAFFEDYIQNNNKDFHNSAILIIDIDKFKQINDKHGHSFADSMLKYVSNVIKKYIRSSDIIARYGGDEFIIFMENISKATAENIAFRIQQIIENTTFKNANCTVSIGVCYINTSDKLKIQEAISIADKFMYIAKKNGGNAVHICA